LGGVKRAGPSPTLKSLKIQFKKGCICFLIKKKEKKEKKDLPTKDKLRFNFY
jgi:hypothetical protein